MTIMSPWLPPDALAPPAFEPAIDRLVGDWAAHWFVKARASCRSRVRDGATIDGDRLAWRSVGGEVGAAIDEAGRLALAEAMLDRPLAANSVQPADRPLLVDMTDRCLDDLLGRLSWLIDHQRAPVIDHEPPRADQGIRWDIGLRRSGAAIGLTIGRAALVRWRRAPAPAAAPPRLDGIGKALLGVEVPVALQAGRGSIRVGDLETLARGDVVILDRLVDGPMQLLAAGAASGLAGKLVIDEGSLMVDIIERKKVVR